MAERTFETVDGLPSGSFRARERAPHREGMRIDFVLGSPALATRVTGALIDPEERKGRARAITHRSWWRSARPDRMRWAPLRRGDD